MPSFTPNSVERIRQTVKTVESLPRDLTGDTNRGQHVEPSFWARLDAIDINGGHYAWTHVLPDGRGGFDPDGRASGAWAFEVHGQQGVAPGTIVRLFLVGQTEGGELIYQFMAPPKVDGWQVPLHDHRENEDGGMTFGCYHSGLPIPDTVDFLP